MKIRKRQGIMSNFDPEDLRDFLLLHHDWFGFFEDLSRDQIKQLWREHKTELMTPWNAPRGDHKVDPLHFTEHGKHIKCWAEEHLE